MSIVVRHDVPAWAQGIMGYTTGYAQGRTENERRKVERQERERERQERRLLELQRSAMGVVSQMERQRAIQGRQEALREERQAKETEADRQAEEYYQIMAPMLPGAQGALPGAAPGVEAPAPYTGQRGYRGLSYGGAPNVPSDAELADMLFGQAEAKFTEHPPQHPAVQALAGVHQQGYAKYLQSVHLLREAKNLDPGTRVQVLKTLLGEGERWDKMIAQSEAQQAKQQAQAEAAAKFPQPKFGADGAYLGHWDPLTGKYLTAKESPQQRQARERVDDRIEASKEQQEDAEDRRQQDEKDIVDAVKELTKKAEGVPPTAEQFKDYMTKKMAAEEAGRRVVATQKTAEIRDRNLALLAEQQAIRNRAAPQSGFERIQRLAQGIDPKTGLAPGQAGPPADAAAMQAAPQAVPSGTPTPEQWLAATNVDSEASPKPLAAAYKAIFQEGIQNVSDPRWQPIWSSLSKKQQIAVVRALKELGLLAAFVGVAPTG